MPNLTCACSLDEQIQSVLKVLGDRGFKGTVYGSYDYGLSNPRDIDIAVSGYEVGEIKSNPPFIDLMEELSFKRMFHTDGDSYFDGDAVLATFRNNNYSPPIQIIVFSAEWHQRALIASDVIKDILRGYFCDIIFKRAHELRSILLDKNLRHGVFAAIEEAFLRYADDSTLFCACGKPYSSDSAICPACVERAVNQSAITVREQRDGLLNAAKLVLLQFDRCNGHSLISKRALEALMSQVLACRQ